MGLFKGLGRCFQFDPVIKKKFFEITLPLSNSIRLEKVFWTDIFFKLLSSHDIIIKEELLIYLEFSFLKNQRNEFYSLLLKTRI